MYGGGMYGGGMYGGGMYGGGIPGMGGGTPEDIDDASYIIVTVLQVNNIGNKLKNFEAGNYNQTGIPFTHRWGKTVLKSKTPMYEVIPLKSRGQLVQSAAVRFEAQKQKYAGMATAKDQIDLARWALEHNLLNEFIKTMDALNESKPDDPSVKPILEAYNKIKTDLQTPPTTSRANEWKSKLLNSYYIAEGKFYDIIHTHQSDTINEVKPLLNLMETALQNYYYWWALNGRALPLPTEKQVAIFADRGEDFKKLQTHLTASPVVTDSFFARREGLMVFAGKRNDDSYATLDRTAKPYWQRGYLRNELLLGTQKSGIPKELLPRLLSGQPVEEFDNARFFALMLKSMEAEWEATGISHEASRQLVYSSGLLPPKVNAPEWILFGMGSFFEIPLQSPFGGVGSPSPYWLPRFKENYKAKQYNRDPNASAPPSSLEALIRVVTDAGFRSKPEKVTPWPNESPQMTENRARESHLRRSRAAAWALTYFLAQRNNNGLQRYFQELSRMPRDIELDEKVLLGCFARAFDCVNLDKSINNGRLQALADRWIQVINSTPLEAEEVHNQIREYYKRATANQPPRSGSGNTSPGGPAIPGAPGIPGGGRGPGAGGS